MNRTGTLHRAMILVVFVLLSSDAVAQASLDTLNQKLDSLRVAYETMGVSVCVVKNGSVLFTKGYGLADFARQFPITDSTLYRIASVSKSIAATAIMQLYELGKFRLDEDVSRYLGFTLRNPNFPNDSITFRKLLSHTSSLRDGNGYDAFLSATYNTDPPPVLQSLLLPGGAYYTPGTWNSSRAPSADYFVYSNINFGVVGTLVERISGERFDVYCRNHILQPLGMTASFNIQDIPNINNVAVLYRKPGGVWTPQADNYLGVRPPPRNLSGYVVGTNGFIFAPQGGLRTSVNDLAKFMLAHMNGGAYNGVRILNDTTVARMHAVVWSFNGSNGDNYYGIFNRYGLGMSTTAELLPTETLLGHPGEAYGLISDMYFSQDHTYGIIFMTNGGARNPWDLGRYSGWYRIEEDAFQAVLKYAVRGTTGVSVGGFGLPRRFELDQNYPNPFNPLTTIHYQLPVDNWVSLKVYDLLGREVAVLVNEVKEPGSYEIKFSASGGSASGGDVAGLASGVYLYRLIAGRYVETRKMLLLQ